MKVGFIVLIASFLYCIVCDTTQKREGIKMKNLPIFSFPDNATPQMVGKLVTENLLSRDYMIRADKSGIHYAEICTAYGAINFANQIQDTSLSLLLEERYSCFLNTNQCDLIPPGSHNKFTVALVVMAMYNHNKQQGSLDRVLSLAQDKWDSWANPNPKTDILQSARFWADDMYFTPTLESQIFKVNGDPSTIDRVTKWLTNYVDSLLLPNGLIKHTTQVPFAWGRGMGWAAVGMTNALQYITDDHPKRQHLMDAYLKMMAGLKPYQTSNGLWCQLIDYPNAWEETSGSAMVTYAMVTGIRLGWLDPDIYSPIVEKAWLALVDKLNEKGELKDVCVGTNEKFTAQEYLDRKRITGDFHGQAPILWTANSLLLLEKNINDSTKEPIE